MKRLISLFKKFPSINQSGIVFSPTFTLSVTIALSVTIVCIGGCFLQSQDGFLSPEPVAVVPSPAPTTWRPITTMGGSLLAHLADSSCSAKAKEMEWQIPFLSATGSHRLVVHHVKSAAKPLWIRAQIDGVQVTQNLDTGISPEFMAASCASSRAAELEAELIDTIREWLAVITPDCDFNPASRPQNQKGGAETTSHWYCSLPQSRPEDAAIELAGIQSQMLRRWSRQPYLLARRIALTRTLAKVLTTPPDRESLKVFCRTIHNSRTQELTIAMAAPRWQRAVCGVTGETAGEIARYGLAKSVAEIDLMRQLYVQTSKLGYLTIRIPSGQVPTRNIWVSLTPTEEVASHLLSQTSRHWQASGAEGSSPTDDGDRHRAAACWHPVFGAQPKLLRLASFLDLVGDPGEAKCKYSQVDRTRYLTPSEYIAATLTSETEFVISNGRAKMLRLPQGAYRYSLQGLPDDPNSWDEATGGDPASQGTIKWTARRPRPTIRTW